MDNDKKFVGELSFINDKKVNYLTEEPTKKVALFQTNGDLMWKGDIKYIGAARRGFFLKDLREIRSKDTLQHEKISLESLATLAISFVLKKNSPLHRRHLEIYSPGKVALTVAGFTNETVAATVGAVAHNELSITQEEYSKGARGIYTRTGIYGADTALSKEGVPTAFYFDLLARLKNSAPDDGWKLLIFYPVERFLGCEPDNSFGVMKFKILIENMQIELGYPGILFG